jgi:hypothetical protein
MPSFLAGIVVALAVLAVVVQLALPAYLAGRVEARLEEGGGTAKVDLGAFPAVSLLAGRGGSFEAEGSGLRLDPDAPSQDPFEQLDGFKRVNVRLSDLDAGPLRIARFELTRDGRGEDYELTVRATTTARELAGRLGSAAGGPLGGLVGSLAGGIVPGAGRAAIPLELRATVTSDDGRPDVADAGGSVAGLPAGPLAKLVLAVVLDRV